MNTRFALFGCIVLFGSALASLAPAGAAPAASPPAVSPAVAVVREFLADRAAGRYAAAYALLSAATQAQMPFGRQQEMVKQISAPNVLSTLPPGLLPIIALFGDFQGTLHFKFRVLGPSPDDPALVLVRAYQVGTPLSAVKTLKIVITPDPAAAGALRLDGEKTMRLVIPAPTGDEKRDTSQSNLKQIALGVLQYEQDNNQMLPDAANWVDEVMPYIKSEPVFHDPSAPDDQKWSYAFNSTLSHQPLTAMADPAQTVLLFESTLGVKNASDTGQSVPVPGRHNGGTDYALADGHVKWFKDGTPLSYRLDGK